MQPWVRPGTCPQKMMLAGARDGGEEVLVTLERDKIESRTQEGSAPAQSVQPSARYTTAPQGSRMSTPLKLYLICTADSQ